MEKRAAAVVRASLRNVLAAVYEHEQELGKLDAAAGDGDHGATVVRGYQAAVAALDAADAEASAADLLMAAGAAFADAAGGASGALYGMFFTTLGQTLGTDSGDAMAIGDALRAGVAIVGKLGKAKPGDKTMLDTLDPFVAALTAGSLTSANLATAWRNALPAAAAGAAATASMTARRGRASRLGERSVGQPDPGAVSALYLLQAVGAALDQICGA